GTDINLLFRMLEARPLRHALAGSTAELALIVSDDVYRSLVCRCPSLVSPEVFQQVRFQVKHTRARAWIYLPGAPSRSSSSHRRPCLDASACISSRCQHVPGDGADTRTHYGRIW